MNLLITSRLEQFHNVVAETEVTDTQSNLSLEAGINRTYEILKGIRDARRDLYIIGNGGSAAVASHAVIDFMNVGKISAHTLHEPAILTCMSNDYGYEKAFSNIINVAVKPNDLLIAISSSGQSENIIGAVQSAKNNGSMIITFSGFNPGNKLSLLGDINFWSNSNDYGMVEMTHQFILHNLADRFQHSGSHEA